MSMPLLSAALLAVLVVPSLSSEAAVEASSIVKDIRFGNKGNFGRRSLLQDAAATPISTQSLQGKVVLIPGHDGSTQYFLSAITGEGRSLVKLPGPPLDAKGNIIGVGSTVVLTCGLLQDNTCDAMSTAQLVVVSGAGAGATRAIGGNETINLLVALLIVPEDAPCRQTVGRHTMNARDITSSFGVAAGRVNTCSMNTKAVNIRWVVNVTLKGASACTYLATSWCEWQAYISQATSGALASDYGELAGTYTHVAMVLPADVNQCGMEAAGLVGGTETFFTTGVQGKGAWSAATIAQELLHNGGLYHGSRDPGGSDDICACEQTCTLPQKTSCCQGSPCTHEEYGDTSTCMVADPLDRQRIRRTDIRSRDGPLPCHPPK